MASSGNEEAKFSLNLDSNAAEVSTTSANALDGLRKSIVSGQESLKGMNAALRSLTGKTEEVVSAKAELKAKIEAEKAALSSANLAILKQGTTYDALAGKAKQLANEHGGMGKAIEAAGGPIASIRDKLASAKELFGGAGGAANLMTFAVAGLVAIVAALAVALVAGTIALAKFVIESANLARTQGLAREAITGSAEDAARLGEQVDALAGKVPTSTAALNDLAISLRKNGLSGQTLVDTFNAVGQASAALGDDAGGKLRDIVERGKLTQRISIGRDELQGTGVNRDDVAKQLAKSMHVGVDQARQALAEGRVSLGDGAKAIRDAVEKNIGGVNLKKMLDLGVIADKFNQKLQNLTKGIKLDKLLEQFEKLADLFDGDTVTGSAIQKVVTLVGQGLVDAITTVIPHMIMLGEKMVLAGLKIYIQWLTVKKLFTDFFDGGSWKDFGIGLVDGFVSGIESGFGAVQKVLTELAQHSIDTFREKLGIHSPSKVFAEFGGDTAEGYSQGVDSGAPAAQKSVDSMVAPPTSGAGGGGLGKTAITVNVTIHAGGGGDAAKQLGDAGFLAKLTKAVEDALTGAGVPVQA